MSSSVEDLMRRGWVVLSPPSTSQLSSFSLPMLENQTAELRLALDRIGARHLLIPTSAHLELVADENSVLQLSSSMLKFGNSVQEYLVVRCEVFDLFPEFDELLVEVIEAVRVQTQSSEKTAIEIVDRWKRLFSVLGNRGLSLEGQIGLFAELILLRALVARDPQATSLWTGPDMSPHDFEFVAASVEIKGIGKSADHVVVHGLAQLDETNHKPLALVLAFLEMSSSGESLQELVSHLEGTVSDPNLLRKKLREAGFTGQEAPARFRVSELRVIEVGANTPRLISADLITGDISPAISNLSYWLDIAALIPISSKRTVINLVSEYL